MSVWMRRGERVIGKILGGFAARSSDYCGVFQFALFLDIVFRYLVSARMLERIHNNEVRKEME